MIEKIRIEKTLLALAEDRAPATARDSIKRGIAKASSGEWISPALYLAHVTSLLSLSAPSFLEQAPQDSFISSRTEELCS